MLPTRGFRFRHLAPTGRNSCKASEPRSAESALTADPAGINPAARLGLRENLADDVAVHVGQPAIDAVVVEREALVIDAQKVQNSGVKVVPARAFLDGLV